MDPPQGSDAFSSASAAANSTTAPSRRSRPPLSLASASFRRASTPATSDDIPPQSPAVVLSPSTPDSPTVGTHAVPTELIPAQILPPPRTSGFGRVLQGMSGDGEELDDVELVCGGERTLEEKGISPILRDSLALLDSRMAEIESFGFGEGGRPATEEKTAHLPVCSLPP